MLMGVILPYANFFIFLGLAIYFFRKPAREAAAKKKNDYDRLVNEAKRANDEAQARLAELTKRYERLDSELKEIKELAKSSADTDAAKIVADAERLAEHLKLEAKRIAEAEVENARGALRDEILQQVRGAVVAKIKTELSAASHQDLIKRRVADLTKIDTRA